MAKENRASASDLGKLTDPNFFREPIELGDAANKEDLLRQLRMMLRIRFVEEVVGDLVEAGEAGCPCHLAIGQEAIAVGVSEALMPNDKVYGGHRSHAHYLVLGGGVYELLSEILGRETGCSAGRGGSMHIYGGEHGFVGSVPLVGATIPLAVGSALAAKFDQNGAVAVSYFGDGACEEGVLHESLNLAVTLKLPVLFVCENNLFASHMDIHLRQPSNRMARFAEANRVQARIVDGNDVVAVAAAALELTREMRSGKGPGFIEAVTYRWRGHVGPNMDIDVGVRRTMSDVNAWQKRDPIGRLVKAMEQCGMLSGTEFARLREEELEAVISARDKSREAPYPNPGSLLDKVYKSANPGQRLAT